MEKHKMLALSTAHVKSETAALMDAGKIEGVVLYNKGEYGWVVCIPEDIDEIDELQGKIPDDLYECMYFASNNWFDWLMFDRDVEVIGNLPVYEW